MMRVQLSEAQNQVLAASLRDLAAKIESGEIRISDLEFGYRTYGDDPGVRLYEVLDDPGLIVGGHFHIEYDIMADVTADA